MFQAVVRLMWMYRLIRNLNFFTFHSKTPSRFTKTEYISLCCKKTFQHAHNKPRRRRIMPLRSKIFYNGIIINEQGNKRHHNHTLKHTALLVKKPPKPALLNYPEFLFFISSSYLGK